LGQATSPNLQAELDAIELPVVRDVSEAAAALTNFALFWERETDAKERNKLLHVIFDWAWVDDKLLVAVEPRKAFLPYFE
jgi:hypothetical protein